MRVMQVMLVSCYVVTDLPVLVMGTSFSASLGNADRHSQQKGIFLSGGRLSWKQMSRVGADVLKTRSREGQGERHLAWRVALITSVLAIRPLSWKPPSTV